MKEIKILIQQLRSYPDNFFVYSQEEQDPEYTTRSPEDNNRTGLVVTDYLGKEQGFIETGGKEGVVIE